MAHRFWEYEPAQRGNQINHFLKNLALIGAMLFIVVSGPGSASVDKN
jgi:putative oxidoreductase